MRSAKAAAEADCFRPEAVVRGAKALYSKLPYDAFKDFALVSQVLISPSVAIMAPALGVRSVNELIALARQKPRPINFGRSGYSARRE
jgi:tripartite-type tricarboxylate transporter receptor subunit TctC